MAAMFSRLRLRQRNSLQPLLAMFVVVIMPVFMTSKVKLGTPAIKLQLTFAGIFIAVGLGVWAWGSRKALLSLILFYTALSTGLLIVALLGLLVNLSSFSSNQAVLLMRDALVIWSMTVLTFSLWYWLLDSGWTEKQGVKDTTRQDFLFPQQANKIPEWENWQPGYLEYLHLAFNTNTAFSPTDIMPLSHRVKILMIVQSSLSLVIISTVGAQAINILSN